MTTGAVLAVDHLTVEFRSGFRGASVPAVDDVSFAVGPAETVAIVGGAGAGKSTLGGAILGVRTVARGTVRLRGEDITRASRARRRALGNDLQAVFQDPLDSLDPAHPIADAIGEGLVVGTALSRHDVSDRVLDVLERVGLPRAAAARYPAELSREQLQRIAFARAIVRRPAIIVCDDALGSIPAEAHDLVVDLLDELQQTVGTSFLVLARDETLSGLVCDRILHLDRGRLTS